MHRSGTSLVSRMLNLTGVHLGTPAAVSGAAPDNPKGYWEHHPLALLNDDILAAFGGRWDDPPQFPPGWADDPRLDEVKARARHILTSEFAAQPVWGWKDPRTCLTTPVWQQLVGPMRYVICVRNPKAVAQSLGRRDHMSTSQADRLWLTYVGSSLLHTSDQPRMFVFYDDVMADWPRQFERLAAFAGCADRVEDAAVRASIAEFIEGELFHHRPSDDDLAADTHISFAAKSLYLALRAQARVESAQRSLDLLAAQAIDAVRQQDTFAAEHDRLVVARDRLEAEHSDLMSAHQAQSADVGALRVESADLHASVSQLSTERDLVAARANGLDHEVSRLSGDLANAQGDLDEIRTSSAWTLVLFLRRVVNAIFPAGTGRRRVFIRLVHAISRRLRGAPAS